MSDRKRNILEALERIAFFGDDNLQLKTDLPITTGLFADNKTNIERLHQAGVTKDAAGAAGKSHTRSKIALARSIHKELRRVAKTARRIEKKVADFENAFEMSHGNLSYTQLIDRADAFLNKRRESVAHFAEFGLTDEYFAGLREEVDELREATEGQADAKRTNVGASADTEDVLEDALETRADLRTAIENHYRNDPAKLAEWLTASHIRRRDETSPPAAANSPVS